MAVRALYILTGGTLFLEKSALISGYHGGEKMIAPITMALIVCDDCNIVFDTGLHSGGIDDPLGTWGERGLALFKPTMSREDDIENRLNDVGYGIQQIDFVINSHLHFDHSGGNRLFRHSKILVQKAEYRFACYPDTYAEKSFPKNHFDHSHLNYHLLEGDTKVCDGVQIVLTKGHTAGHQSLVVDLNKSGTIILPGDAIPTDANSRENLLPGPVWSAPEAYYSILKLKNIAQSKNGMILFSHDDLFIKNSKTAPDYYE